MTTHGAVAGSMRRTIEGLREANAGLCRENQEWQDRCLAMQTERDALRAEMSKPGAEWGVAERLGKRAEAAEAALRKLTVDAALQGRVFKGNEELPGAEEFYRAYNAGIKTQFKYTRDIALAALLDTALAEQAREEE